MRRIPMRTIRGFCFAGMMAGVALAWVPLSTLRAATFTTTTNGTWNTGTPWGNVGSTPGVHYPSTGDEANIAHNLTVTGNQVFGDAANQSDWSDNDISISGASDTLTHDPNQDGSTFNVTIAAGDVRLQGSGTFYNKGLVNHSGAGIFYLGVGSTPTFRNQDTMEISSTGDFTLYSGQFINESGAVIQRTASGEALINTHASGVAPVFHAQSGTIFNAVDAASLIRVDIDNTAKTALGTVKNASFQGNGTIEFDGIWSEISGTITGNANVQLEGTTHLVPTGGTVYDVTGNDNGLEWSTGFIETVTGRNATNNGVMTNIGTELRVNGTGEFINAEGATFRWKSGVNANMYVGVTAGNTSDFRNFGTFEFLDTGLTSTFGTFQAGTSFVNEATGVIRRDVTGTGIFSRHVSGGAGTTAFNNLGTVEVTAGEIEITNAVTTTSVSGGNTLTEGTWNVLSGAGTATLDLRAGGTSAGSIHTIGAAAKVVLGGNNPVFSQLSTNSLTVNGTFGLRDQKVYSLTSDLTSPGILEFGLEADDVGGTLLTGLNVTGNVNFTGGTVNILDLGGMTVGTYRLIEWDGTRIGELTLGSTPNNGFVYELFTTDTGSGFVELNVSTPPPIPEPGSLLMLAFGALGLVRRVRKRGGEQR